MECYSKCVEKLRGSLFFVAVLAFGLLVLIFRLGESPPILNQDEASIANEAYSIANNLKSTQGKLLPLFFDTLGNRHDWKNPFSIYWVAVWVKVLGFNTFITRLAMVGLAFVSIIFLWLIIGLLFPSKKWVRVLSCLFLLVSPLFLIQARQVIDPISLVALLMAQIYFGIKFGKTKKNRYLWVSSICAGIGFYTYHPARLYSLLYLLISEICFLDWSRRGRRASIGLVIISTVIFLIILIPALYWNFKIEPGIIVNRYQGLLVPRKLAELLMIPVNYLRYFDLSFLFGVGDTDILHSTGRAGVFPLTGVIVLGLTFYRMIKNGTDRVGCFLLLCFLTYPIGLMFTAETYRACRGINIVPIAVVLSAWGFDYLLMFNKWWLRGVFVIFAIQSSLFLYDFYYLYPVRVGNDWRFRLPLARQIESVVRDYKNYPGKIYIDTKTWFAKDDLVYFENIYGKTTNVFFIDDIGVASQSATLFLSDQIAHPADEIPKGVKIFSQYAETYLLGKE